MHQSEYQEAKYFEEYREWNRLSLSDKCFTVLNDNKYKIIISAWAGSLYGSWYWLTETKLWIPHKKLFKQECTHKVSPLYYYWVLFLLAMKEEEINKRNQTNSRMEENYYGKEAEDKRLVDEANKVAQEKATQ